MATEHLRGDAFFEWLAGSTTTQHLLAIPLHELEPVDLQERHDWWSADNREREIVALGISHVQEIYGTIRFDNQPVALKAMLRDALLFNTQLTYYQNSVGYPVHLVAVVGASSMDETPIKPDRDRHGYGEWECRVRLRRIDGGDLDGIFS